MKKISICLSIFVLLIIVVLSSGLSFSRYTSTICNTGDESTIITVNKYNLIAQWGTEPQDLQHPGIEDQIYNFTLENKFPNGSETQTEDLSYAITVTMDWNEATPVIGLKVPLDMRLYIVGANETLTDITYPPPAGTSVNYISTQEGVIVGGESIDFRLEWNWGTSVTDRDYRFANRMIDVKINVQAEQLIVDDPEV